MAFNAHVARRAGLDEGDHLLQVGGPVLLRLLRQAENEIDGEIVEATLPGHVDNGSRLLGRVGPIHEAEIVLVEGLNADAEPIDAQRPEAPQVLQVHVVRVEFQRDLRVVRDRVATVQALEERGEFVVG